MLNKDKNNSHFSFYLPLPKNSLPSTTLKFPHKNLWKHLLNYKISNHD